MERSEIGPIGALEADGSTTGWKFVLNRRGRFEQNADPTRSSGLSRACHCVVFCEVEKRR
ncbi:hypothetical protein RRF57_008441 [Xylaria bambusicola]|uniref:Uncharacterized protein n=1 Tax=Xylaria bambusicola TaxID=326684 RepID=A0AAN7UPF7_9PEZI